MLSEHYGAPVMLFALLLGMGLNFLADDTKCKAGIEFTARTVLRVGIALLGMRITLSQITALGMAADCIGFNFSGCDHYCINCCGKNAWF